MIHFPERSWRLIKEYYFMKPILDYNGTYDKFIDINSCWADFSSYSGMIEANKKFIKYSKEKLDI